MMFSSQWFLIFLSFFIHSCTCDNNELKDLSGQEEYFIVVDGGSTGSRGFFDGNRINVTQGKKITPGLSSFVENLGDLDSYLEPIFTDAAEHIPVQYHSTAEVFILGTAGMRLLSLEQQELIWNGVYKALSRQSFPFLVNRENFRTIDGKFEAYYAVIATNFIAGRIGIDLIPNGNMIGALDMGGSSTQLVFHTGTKSNERVHPDHFWSHSWLSFGAEKIQERVWYTLFQNHVATSQFDEKLYNPCLFKGYRTLYHFNETSPEGTDSVPKFIFMEGTGEPLKCRDMIRNTLWPEGCEAGGPCPVENIHHPPVDGLFFGISVYFFALDCVRHYGTKALPHWPNPSIDELEDASLEFCQIPWNDIYSSHQSNSHEMTSEEKLPNRCVEALYITTLLEDGFGFRGTHRGITLALEVDGTEVEWTLGFALAEECLKRTNAFETEDVDNFSNSSKESTKEQSSGHDSKKMNVLRLYYLSSQKFISQKLRSISRLTQLSITKVSALLVNVFHALSKRLHFTSQLLIIKPLRLLAENLMKLFAQFKQITNKTRVMVRNRLAPSIGRILSFRRGKNSTNPSSSN